MDYLTLLLAVICILLLLVTYFSFRAWSNIKREELRDVMERLTKGPQYEQVLKDIAKVLLNLQQQQQVLKGEVDKALISITDLELSFQPLVEVAQRLDRILTDPQAKGALGEQIVARYLEQLPQEWVRRNVQFRNDTHVEFCVCSPDGRLIPIDSKWSGTELFNQLTKTNKKTERDKLIRAIQKEVLLRGLEVRKYLDDYRTIGFCIATVPDGVFNLCLDVQPVLIKRNIVLISYSLLVPYILILVKLFLSNAQAIQAMTVSTIISSSIIEIEQIQGFIDTKLVRPLDTVNQQQTEYRSQNEKLQAVYNKLLQVQIDLEVVKKSLPTGINPLSNSEISSIPNELKHRLDELRKSMIENRAKQNGHVPNDINQNQ